MRFLFLALLILVKGANAQSIVVDPQHINAVIQNGIVRSSAESTHEQYLGKINNNIDNINTNVGAVVIAQTIIYNSLANVNSALKDGLEVKNMALVTADMIGYLNKALLLAKADPYLLLFAGNISTLMQQKALALLNDVSGFVLKEGNNVLADYNARDELLRKVTQQLQILDGLAYGAWKAMFWAKEKGVFASAPPFAGFINKDKLFVAQIIQNAKFLHE